MCSTHIVLCAVSNSFIHSSLNHIIHSFNLFVVFCLLRCCSVRFLKCSCIQQSHVSNRCSGKSLNAIENVCMRDMTNIVNLIKELVTSVGRFSRFLHCISMCSFIRFVFLSWSLLSSFTFKRFLFICWWTAIPTACNRICCICMQYSYYAVCSMYVHLFE